MKLCSITLLQGVQTNFSIGQLQEVFGSSLLSLAIFHQLTHDSKKIFSDLFQAYMFLEDSGGYVAFLVNNNGKDTATVQFHNASFELLPKSISILPDCQNVAFNTAIVSFGFT